MPPLSVVPGAGHAVHIERPDEFLGDVREFIARCEVPTPSVARR